MIPESTPEPFPYLPFMILVPISIVHCAPLACGLFPPLDESCAGVGLGQAEGVMINFC